MSDLTPELKATIDAMSYEAMLSKNRFAPIGTAIFQGESGKYFLKVMAEKRDASSEEAVRASKSIGW